MAENNRARRCFARLVSPSVLRRGMPTHAFCHERLGANLAASRGVKNLKKVNLQWGITAVYCNLESLTEARIIE